MKLDGVLSTSEPYAHGAKPGDEDPDLLERSQMRPRSKISAKLVRLSPSSLSGDAIACAFVVGSLVTVFVVLKEEEEIK